MLVYYLLVILILCRLVILTNILISFTASYRTY